MQLYANVGARRTVTALITAVAAVMAAVMPVSTANANEFSPKSVVSDLRSGDDQSASLPTDAQSEAILAHVANDVLSYGAALNDPAVDPELLYRFAVVHLSSGGGITDITNRQREALQLEAAEFDSNVDQINRDAFDITELSDSEFQYVVDGETYTASVDATAGTTTITDPSGTQTVVELPDESTTTAATACWVLLWAVGILHQYGWGVAIGILAASGAAGAAALAIVYSMGVSLFFAWVGNRC